MTTITSRSGRTIILRPPQPGDEQILFDYAQELAAEDTYILLNPDEPVTWNEEVNYLKGILKKIEAKWQVHYLAFHGNQLIGSSQVSLQGRRKKHVGAFGISINQLYRNDGIGTQLATFVLNEAKSVLGITLVTLEVFANNEVAKKLYRRLGFNEFGRLPGGLVYKGEPVDSILMYRSL